MTPGTRGPGNGKDNQTSLKAIQDGKQAGRNGSQAPVSVQQVIQSGTYLSARDQVMIEFQRSSLEMARRFIETQQNVMLAYLNRSNGTHLPVIQYEPELQVQETVQAAPAITYTPAINYAPQPPQAPATARVEQTFVQQNLAQLVNEVTGPAEYKQEIAASPAPVASVAPVAAAPQSIPNLSSDSSTLNPEKLIESLIEIVSERTGYPPEMLDPALDLEADLGIDSIKRVEILNSFRKLLPQETQTLLEDGIEKLAGVKTLAGIIDWIRTDLDPAKIAAAAAEASSEAERELV